MKASTTILATAIAAAISTAPIPASSAELVEWKVSNESGWLVIQGYLTGAAKSISAVVHCDGEYIGNDRSIVDASGTFTWMLRDSACHGIVEISRVTADGHPVSLPKADVDSNFGLSDRANTLPTDGKNPVLEGNHRFVMTDQEWYAWHKSGIPECEAVPVAGFGKSDPVKQTTWVQTRLTDLGYDPGDVDGKSGPKTDAAEKAFATDHGFPFDSYGGGLLFAALVPGACFVPEIAHSMHCHNAVMSGYGGELQLKMLNDGRVDELMKIQRETQDKCRSGEWDTDQVKDHLALIYKNSK